MAKGIGINGQFRGRIGGTVYSRVNGEQVSRAYNPNVSNPRTSRQLYQRAIMATVMRAYKQGKDIYNHSFEGQVVGSGNQRRFISLNSRKLRSLLAIDVNSRLTENAAKAHLCAPGVETPVPNAWTVSEGSLGLNFFTITAGTSTVEAKITIPAAASANETVDEYCSRLGLVPGEIYTFVGHSVSELDPVVEIVEDNAYASVLKSYFGFVRLTVKNDVLSNSNVAENVPLSDIFNVEASTLATERISSVTIDTAQVESSMSDIFSINGNAPVVFGIIRSDEDSRLRSNCTLVPRGGQATGGWGLKYMYALDAWKMRSEKIGSSDLILEGGSF